MFSWVMGYVSGKLGWKRCGSHMQGDGKGDITGIHRGYSWVIGEFHLCRVQPRWW